MSVIAAPKRANEHIAWAELGIELDQMHCNECGRGLTFDNFENRWCSRCDEDLANMLEEQYETACRVCGCTDLDCSGCIERTGSPCYWVEPDLCSACVTEPTA